MSSILIKGMEMPNEGTVIAVYKIDGKLYATRGLSGRLCPLVPVPPHGRLIDADELRAEHDKISGDYCHGYYKSTWDYICAAREMIKAAPTILEAEEGET